jgi:multidrug efflux pump subunit AcrA (membrane-fusion protein)
LQGLAAGYLVALAMLGFGVFHLLKAQQTLPKPPPPVEPARNPFGHGIAAAGIVESRSENIAIGSALPGLVLEVFVPVEKVGAEVSAGDALFRVDDRQLRARPSWPPPRPSSPSSLRSRGPRKSRRPRLA